MNKQMLMKMTMRSAVVLAAAVVLLALIDGFFGTNSLETALEGLGLTSKGGGE
jgi:hypothetical protein